MNGRRQTKLRHHRLKEAAAFGHAFNEVDVKTRTVPAKYGQDHAGKTGTGPQVRPGQGLRRKGEELGGVQGVPGPEGGQGGGTHQVHPLVPVLKPSPVDLKIRQGPVIGPGQGGEGLGGKGGFRRRGGGHGPEER